MGLGAGSDPTAVSPHPDVPPVPPSMRSPQSQDIAPGAQGVINKNALFSSTTKFPSVLAGWV